MLKICKRVRNEELHVQIHCQIIITNHMQIYNKTFANEKQNMQM